MDDFLRTSGGGQVAGENRVAIPANGHLAAVEIMKRYDVMNTVNVSKMNTGLMGRVFGGTVVRIMGGKVGPEETRLLQDIVN